LRNQSKNNSENSRNKILYAALELFSKKGYAGTSIDDIAKKTEMTKGAIYWHFRDKVDLYTTVHDFVFDEYRKRIMKSLEGLNDPKKKIESFIINTLQFSRDDPAIVSFYTTAFHEGIFSSSTKIQSKIREVYREYRSLISQIILDGIKHEKFIKIDPEIAASILVASLDGILMQWIFEKKIDLDLFARAMASVFFKGFERKVEGRKNLQI
jgi:TetR/AcrR family acrAB operon transcriptional repressor